MSASKFCEQRGYSATRLYWWSSQLKREQGAAANDAAVPIARVVRTGSAPVRSRGAPIVIQVGGARVEVSAEVDRDALSVVLQALASISWAGRS